MTPTPLAFSGFDGFMAQWTGLQQAHAEREVTRTNLTIEDKVWMLERLTGQAAETNSIDAAGFGGIAPGAGRS